MSSPSSRTRTKAKPTSPQPKLTLPPLTAKVHTLGNGLEVLVREDHQHPLVSVQIWIKAGSIHEEEWTGAGLAHCVEHMLFKGTRKRNAQEISTGIQKLGGYVNAYTSFNRTVYWIDGLAEHTEGYLDILADMVRNSRFDAAELTKEQDVIRREMAMDEDEPSSQLQHLVQSTCFRTHPLRHPIIGHRAVFDQVKREDVLAFVQRHYVPNNCFIVIAGAVDAEATFASVERLLGDWERKPYAPVFLPSEPKQKGQRQAHRDFATELSHVSLSWQIPGEGHPDKPALDVLAFLLGSGRSSRLFQELREKHSIAHSVWAGTWCSQETGVFCTEVECDPEKVSPCQKGMLQVIADIKKHGPKPQDLQKALQATLNHQLRSLTTTKGQAAMLGHSWHTIGSLDFSTQFFSTLSRLKPSDIQKAAETYLSEECFSLVTLGPHSPNLEDSKTKVHGKEAVQISKLPNGLTLVLQENPRLPLVSIRSSFLAGVPAEQEKLAGISQVSAALLLKGTKKRSAAQIACELENVGGSLSCHADAHRYLIGADVMSGHENQALDLIADLLTSAKLPTPDLEKVKQRQLAQIQEEKEDPLTVGLRRARALVFAGQPFARTALGTETSVKAMTAADCATMVKESLVSENGVLSIVGNIRARELQKHVTKTFAKLAKGKRRQIIELPTPKIKAQHETLYLEKEQAVLVIAFRSVGLHHQDIHALNLIDEACSDMGSRLFQRIREELGLAYYVGAQHFAALGAGAFYFYVGTAPDKVDLAEKEMLSLLKNLASKGLSTDEIVRAKTAWRSSWLRSQQGNGTLADAYSWSELTGQGYDSYIKMPEKVAAVTPAEIQAAAKKYIKTQEAIIIRVMPKKKPAPASKS